MSLARSIALDRGWQLARTPAGACTTPEALAAAAVLWHDAKVPGTVASSLGHDVDAPGPFDADDWWFRTSFPAPPASPGTRYRLRFEGLATLAQAWLNGQPILDSRNMFVGRRVDATPWLRATNQLVIRFASLEAALAQRRSRPRWRTALVSHQNLRWFRTTLLGRMPGWTPPIAPVGPWRPIALECVDRFDIAALSLQARAQDGIAHLQLRATVACLDGAALDGARLRVNGAPVPLTVLRGRDARIHGDIALPDAPLWWPHTHGEPRRVRCQLELLSGGQWLAVDCGWVGFKEVALDTAGGAVGLRVNGVPVFCRGACWTPEDILSLHGEPEALRATLEAARDAGVNMLRVGGTMAYEADAFYDLCDELGILVWQDFMFANMDYPVGDAAFRAEIEAEARHQLARLQRHACIAVYCGGSEVAQQAAMMGLPAEQWTNEFFAAALPALCAEEHAGIPYFPSTPWGGALPFHVGTGIAHYYGVGAYRRPLADVKAARVKFAAECLGFAHVPEPETMALVGAGMPPAPHHPRWKARVPRDAGSGWDFEDVRDHYLRELFGVDPVALRSRDLERYYALSRVATGEVIRRVYAEWRASASGCGGALVWFLRDLWPGAGWGLVDSTGRPKAALWYAKRAWAPRTVHLTDEGLDGLALHVVNDAPAALEATLELELLREGRVAVARARREIRVPAHGAASFSADALVGHFTDSAHAYRFGPPAHDVAVARLLRGDSVLGEDFHFPLGLGLAPQPAAAVRSQAWRRDDGLVEVRLESDAFLQAVRVACATHLPDDNYFHLAPRRERTLLFAPRPGEGAFEARFDALNRAEPVVVRLPSPASDVRDRAGPSAA